MYVADQVSWTTMMTGHAQNGFSEKAQKTFN